MRKASPDKASTWSSIKNALGVVVLLIMLAYFGCDMVGTQLEALREAFDADTWSAVPARVEALELREHDVSTRNSRAYEYSLQARFTFTYNGREHQGTRFGLDRTRTSRHLEAARRQVRIREDPLSRAWVPPGRPADAVLDRRLPTAAARAASLGFLLLALFGVGLMAGLDNPRGSSSASYPSRHTALDSLSIAFLAVSTLTAAAAWLIPLGIDGVWPCVAVFALNVAGPPVALLAVAARRLFRRLRPPQASPAPSTGPAATWVGLQRPRRSRRSRRAAPTVRVFTPAPATDVILEPLAESRCGFCGGSLAEGQLVTCAACATLHHRDCWNENRGCTTYGCTKRPPTW